MKIVVLDGQGGGLGKLLVETVLNLAPIPRTDFAVYGLGSNSVATSAMLKAGADYGATGENAVIRNVEDATCILGAVGIVLAHGILGEITANMAEAVGASRGRKYLVPMNHCGVFVAGVQPCKLQDYATMAVEQMFLDINTQSCG